MIQLGAILALLSIYFTRLWKIAIGMFTNEADRRFVIGHAMRGRRRTSGAVIPTALIVLRSAPSGAS